MGNLKKSWMERIFRGAGGKGRSVQGGTIVARQRQERVDLLGSSQAEL